MTLELAVLIPVYQNPAGVKKTLLALQNAKWPVEGTVVLVDDGSDPELNLQLDEWAPLKVTLIRLPTNQGVEAALNAGLAFAQDAGVKYIARLDAGDTIHAERLAMQIAVMEAEREVGIVGSDVAFEDQEGRLLFRFVAPCSDREIRRRMHLGLCLIDPAVMFRAAHIGSLGVYAMDCPAAEGYELAFRFLSVCRAQSIPEVLTHTTLESKGLSLTRRRDQLKSKLRVQLRFFDALELNSYVGIVITLLLFLVPRVVVLKLKTIAGSSGL